MNFSLDNNVNKLVLLLVVGVVLLLLIHMYKKNLGEQVSVLLSVVVLVVCGYFGYVLLNSPDENFMNPNESFSPIHDNVEHFQAALNQDALNQDALNQAALNQDALNQAALNQAALNQAAIEEAEEAEDAALKQAANNAALKQDNYLDALKQAAANNAAPSNNSSNNSSNNGVSAEMDSSNLFPTDSYSEWCKVVPNNNGDVNCKSLLNAGHHIGVNTTGCSMRNSNRGLRSEPANPQVQVSPWLQTTICPDPFRKPLDGCN